MKIKQVENYEEKQNIARKILEELPEWFGIEESRENYLKESAEQYFFVALDENQAKGFLCLKETGKDTIELSVIGVLKEYHRQNIGKKLFTHAKKFASDHGYSFIQVKTVQMGHYEQYDNTNRFYLNLGFKEFEVFPSLWDEWNPCQIYIMSLH